MSFASTNSAAYAPFALLAFFIFPVVFGMKLFRLSGAMKSIEIAASLPPMRVPAIANSKE